jgi:ankyrin repeat protein
LSFSDIILTAPKKEGKMPEKNDKSNFFDTELFLAVENGCEKVVKSLLLKHKVNVNAKNNSDWTALHFAVRYGRKKIVKLLLKYGADVNAKNNYGLTALNCAASEGYEKIVKLLLKKWIKSINKKKNN